MGEVYRADDLKLGQSVALKFLPERLEKDPDRLERFLFEARMARSITHPNVCRVHDAYESDGQHFLSMEYVEGEDLASLIRQIGRVNQKRAIEMAHQICVGLAAAHDEGILHRDLKPANIMIDSRGRIRITDFGLAGLANEIIGEEITAGTPAYMSPEQLTAQEVTVQSDIYSLGLVLFELFTGQPAFQADSLADLKRLRLESQPSLPSSLHDGLDLTIERVILRCLKADPTDRPATVKMIASALPGGDPLGAALAAGETPSPEMVAEAGSSESWKPFKALLLAITAISIYFTGMYFQGTLTLTEYLPMDKPPQVLIERAKEIITKLDYTEPVYSHPTDTAFGFFAWAEDLRQIEANDVISGRWDQIRQRPDLLAFWYRQSPVLMRPRPSQEGIGRLSLSLTNPSEEIPGNIEVLLDGEGRLRRFRYTPKSYSAEEPVQVDLNWEELFGLAGLDLNRFRSVRPRYQRLLNSDERWAWVGTRESRPSLEWRVEAGTFEGRIALFSVAMSSTLESVNPKSARPSSLFLFLYYTNHLMILVLVGIAVYLARRNWLRDRCDKRGAKRLGLFFGTLMLVNQVLESHPLFKLMGFGEIWLILAASIFVGIFAWASYLAVEPYGRQVWPSLSVSSSRLLSRARIQWRDSQVGKSVLIGVISGATAALIYPLYNLLPTWIGSTEAPLLQPAWDAIVGQRSALAMLAETLFGSLLSALIPLLMLVAFLHLFRKKSLAVLATLISWPVTYMMMSPSSWIPSILFCCLALPILMRFGFLTLAVFLVVDRTYLVATTSFTSWFSQPSQFAAILVVVLIIYGVWASTAGRKLFEDAVTET